LTLGARRRLAILGVLSPPLLWTLVFMFVPYAIMFTYSFYTRKFPTFVPDFQLGNYLALFADAQYYQVLLRTLKIATAVSISALLLAYPLAYFLAFKVRSASLRTMLYMAVIVPLWVSTCCVPIPGRRSWAARACSTPSSSGSGSWTSRRPCSSTTSSRWC
jgi:spermidine/putrescine transport system permease protein